MSYKSRQASQKKYEVEVWCVAEKNPDFASRMIMKVTGKPYSHVLFYYVDRDGQSKIAHAVSPAVIKEDPEYTAEMLKDHIVVYKKKIKLNCTKEYFCGYVNGSIGKDYGQGQYLYLVFGWKAFKNGRRHTICSEFIGRLMKNESNYKIAVDLDKCKPGHIQEALVMGDGSN